VILQAAVREPSLKTQLRRAERRRRLTAFALVLPLILFLLFTFGIPIATMLWRAVYDPQIDQIMPRTTAVLAHWDGRALPGEDAYRAVAQDLKQASDDDTVALAAKRLNYDVNGFRSLLFKTVNHMPPDDTAAMKEALIAIDPAWGEVATWGAIRNAIGPLTRFYMLAAIDMRQGPDGAIEQRSRDEAVYLDVFLRTFKIALVVTVICLVLGFPLCYLLVSLPNRIAYPMMVFVLVPFWTSLLVRTSAWVVLLQDNGVVNETLMALHLITQPLALIYNRTGVYIAMVHILLPFLVLPLYSVMRGISPDYMRAAASLGARPMRAFLRIYMPQCMPGLTAGCLLVFTVALGFYITPQLVGGASDRMVSYFIAFFTNVSGNWGLACALSVWLLLATLALYGVYGCLVGRGGFTLR
jgi:putative spermidine/putrescine transport system permease protein